MNSQSPDQFEKKAKLWLKWERHLMSPRNFIHRAIAEFFKPQDSGLYLDFATGIGEPVLTIAPAFPEARFWAVDSSAEMIRIAQSRGERTLTKNVRFEQLAQGPLPFASSSMDGAFSVFGLEYVSLPEYLPELFRILKQGSSLVVVSWGLVENNKVHATLIRPLSLFPKAPSVHHFPLFSLSNIQNLTRPAEAAGFKLREVRRMDGEFSWSSVSEFYEMKKEVSPPVSDFLSTLNCQEEARFLNDLEIECKNCWDQQVLKTSFQVNLTILDKL